MAIGIRYSSPDVFEVDSNGVPLAGAQLYFYATTTTTPQNTYSNVGLTVANANPVLADANGRFGAIFLIQSNAYAVELWTAPTVENPTGSQIWAQDPVGPASGGAVSNSAGIIGEIRQFAGLSGSIPAFWYQCYGQAVSRTTYSAAFAVIGTTWGIGDGTTTFNLPDLRGRMIAGLDNMGGSAASRITAGVSGIAGTTLGATGGDQQLYQHTHTVNDPTHVHGLSDPGHQHDIKVTAGGGIVLGLFGGSGPSTLPFPSDVAPTGIAMSGAATGITNFNTGGGHAQNMPPAAICYSIIYLGA